MAVVPIEIPESVLRQVDTLLFDLGGVLFAIDPARSLNAMLALRRADAPPLPEDPLGLPLFADVETGALDAAGFREALRRDLALEGDDATLDAAWNALLVDIVPGRLDLLAGLGRSHRLVMLSNTNPVHVDHLRRVAAPLFACFDEVLLSYELGARKPDPTIFERAARRAGIDPSRCLFLDDGKAHCAASETVGYRSQWVEASRL